MNRSERMVRLSDAGLYTGSSHYTFKSLTKDSEAIRILKICRNYASYRDIYPGVKSPLMLGVKALVKAGALARFAKAKYVKAPDTASKVLYKTTAAGEKILELIGA